MATNKNAQIRYQTLDRCFRNPGRKYFWQDLLEECNRALYEYNGEQSGISRRQLFYDIDFMESEAGWAIPLERMKEGRKTYYRYSDLSFSINNQPLNEQELHELQSAMLILSRFQGIPQLEGLQEIIPRLSAGKTLASLSPVVGFDQNPYLMGSELIGEIFNAIIYRKVLKIRYQDFKSASPYELLFHPYYLKQYNNRWFALGFNEARDQPIWTLALDRIQVAEVVEQDFRDNPDMDWEEYFEDIIGITKRVDEEPIDIELWFSPETAPYVLTKPLHGSQKKLSLDESGLVIGLNLIPNFEFYQILLSFGPRVKVLGPSNVREKVHQDLQAALAYYE